AFLVLRCVDINPSRRMTSLALLGSAIRGSRLSACPSPAASEESSPPPIRMRPERNFPRGGSDNRRAGSGPTRSATAFPPCFVDEPWPKPPSKITFWVYRILTWLIYGYCHELPDFEGICHAG